MPEDNKTDDIYAHRIGRPPKFDTPEAMQKVIIEYFHECDPHWEKETYWDYPVVVITMGKGKSKSTSSYRDKNAEMTEQERMVQTSQKPYTMAGLAARLGMSRQALMDYKAKDDFLDTIKAARGIIEEYNETQLHSGRATTGAIFNLKVNFQYKENEEENKPPENPIQFINQVPMPDDDFTMTTTVSRITPAVPDSPVQPEAS